MPECYTIYTPINLGNWDKCWYCGKSGHTTADHFYPKSKGGRLKVRCCKDCNDMKKNMTPLEFCEYLKCSDLENKDRMITATITLWKRISR